MKGLLSFWRWRQKIESILLILCALLADFSAHMLSNDLLFVAKDVLACAKVLVLRLLWIVITVQVLLRLFANYWFPVIHDYFGGGICSIWRFRLIHGDSWWIQLFFAVLLEHLVEARLTQLVPNRVHVFLLALSSGICYTLFGALMFMVDAHYVQVPDFRTVGDIDAHHHLPAIFAAQ